MTAEKGSGGEPACDLCWPEEGLARQDFIDLVRREGGVRYRDLPWRGIDDPYAVLVSEVMLQQTQVARVKGRWERFMDVFPTLDALAAASTADVLEQWQGLGYNRRALSLKKTADECAAARAGKLPESVEELQKLPGIGPATAAGVVAFAYDRPAVYLETNVRAVFIHELFPGRDKVPDREILPFVADACPATGVRGWYYALLDFGAYLKATVPNPSRRSSAYARQGSFEGSRRQKRAELLRIVLAEPGVAADEALALLDAEERAAGREAVDPVVFQDIVADMVEEGFFRWEDDKFLP